MKQFLFSTTLFAFTLLSTQSIAQQQVSIEVGPSFSNMNISGDGDLIPNPTTYTGIYAGAMYQKPLTQNLSFKTGLAYHLTGFRAKQNFGFDIFDIPIPASVTAITQLHFLEAPVMLHYTFGQGTVKGYIEGGPQVSFAMDGEVITKANLLIDFKLATIDINMSNSNFNQLELSAKAGAGIKWQLNDRTGMHLGANYMYGFTDLTDEPILDIKTKREAFSINTGVSIAF